MSIRGSICTAIVAMMIAMLSVGAATAGIIDDTTDLPPDGVYLSPADVQATYDDPVILNIVLKAVQHRPFADQTVIRERIIDDELETFNSSLTATAVVNSVAFGLVNAEFVLELEGPVQVLTLGKGISDTGTFDTEMISMDLRGVVPGVDLGFGPMNLPIAVRESNSEPSTGQTSIIDISGGLFQIDSFFDVFTEFVVDPDGVLPDPYDPGNPLASLGPYTVPRVGGSTHVDLVPEPGTMAMLGIGLVGFIACLRRRRR